MNDVCTSGYIIQSLIYKMHLIKTIKLCISGICVSVVCDIMMVVIKYSLFYRQN